MLAHVLVAQSIGVELTTDVAISDAVARLVGTGSLVILRRVRNKR